MNEWLQTTIAVFLCCVSFMVALVGVVFGCYLMTDWGHSVSCAGISEKLKVPTQYNHFDGCYVKRDGRWITDEQYRGEEAANNE